MTFETSLLQDLMNLNTNQKRKFLWICTVRVLPFLGNSGKFSFWDIKNRESFLYSILSILDYNLYCLNKPEISDNMAYTPSIKNGFKLIRKYAHSYAYSTYSAYLAAYAIETNSISPHGLVNIVSSTIEAAEASGKVFKTNRLLNKDYFKKVLLSDFNCIKNNECEFENIGVDIYGIVWENFYKALSSEGFAFWGSLYEKIFESGFEYDPISLEKRINIPNEILSLGGVIVSNYLDEMDKQGSLRLNESRIIILGDKGAGKTSLARRLIDPDAPMPKDCESTHGVESALWRLETEKMNVHIWDFAGHVITHAVHNLFLSERCLYILVYDARTDNKDSIDYWLSLIQNYGGNSQIIILVNQRDEHKVTLPERNLKEKYKVLYIRRLSIANSKDIMVLRKDVISYIVQNPSWNNQKIPLNYFKIKAHLEALFYNYQNNISREYISIEEFYNVAQLYNVQDENLLLKNLHALGICFWYSDAMEYNTLVLNPEWITQGVYSIINWAHNHGKEILKYSDFNEIFRDDLPRFGVGKYDFFIKIMIYFELAYEIEAEQSLVIPHLLKEDRPEYLPVFSFLEEPLAIKYQAKMPLPPNTISRLIVRYNRIIMDKKGQKLKWKYGVVLEDHGTVAVIREMNLERTITIDVKGPEKSNFIAEIRKSVNEIFETYKTKKPELEYSIYKLQNSWIKERTVTNYIEKNKKVYYEDNHGVDVDIFELAGAYGVENIHYTVIDKSKKIYAYGSNNNITIDDRSTTIEQGERNELLELCEIMHEYVSRIAKKDCDDIEIIKSQLTTLNEQLKKDKPKKNIIINSLEILKSVLIGVASNQATPIVLSKLEYVLSLFGV